MVLLRAYVEELPRLRARETLRMVEAVALGSGSFKQDAARAAWSELQRQAGVATPQQTSDEKLRMLAGAGVRVVREPVQQVD